MENMTTVTTPSGEDGLLNNYTETMDTAILAIAIHSVGLCFILPTFVMFFKHKCLRRMRNLFQLNLLVSDTVLLFSGWPLLSGTEMGCEIHAFVYLVFAAGSIFSSVLIALLRHETVTKSGNMSYYIQRYRVLWTACLWFVSLLSIALPVHARFSHQNSSPEHIVCFFEASVLYFSPSHAAVYILLVILAPVIIIGYCYTRIYKCVRNARVNSWLTRVVVAYSNSTRILNNAGNGPRATIIPAEANSQPVYPSETVLNLNRREKTLLIKGFASIGIIAVICAPFSVSWLVVSAYGFKADFMRQLRYLMLLSKCSIVAHVFIYIMCDTKLKKFYKSTIFCECRRIFCRQGSEMNVSNNTMVNHIDIHGRVTCDHTTTSPVINGLYTSELVTTDKDTMDITTHPTRISRRTYTDNKLKHLSAKALGSRHSSTVKPMRDMQRNESHGSHSDDM